MLLFKSLGNPRDLISVCARACYLLTSSKMAGKKGKEKKKKGKKGSDGVFDLIYNSDVCDMFARTCCQNLAA